MAIWQTGLISAAFLTGMALTGAYAAEASASEQVVRQFLAAWDAHDVDGMVATFADDAVLIIPQQAPIAGKDNIRGLLSAFAKEFSQAGSKFGAGQLTAAGPVVYFLWNGDTPSNKYSFGADTFVVRDRKIAYETVAFVAAPKQ